MPSAVEENILRTIEENPGTSYRRIALQERRIKPSHCVNGWSILHDELLHHIQHFRLFYQLICNNGSLFCQWLLH